MLPTITDRKIRIAVVGAGRIAKNHVGAIQQNAYHIEVVSVCDRKFERLKAASEECGTLDYSSRRDLLTIDEKPISSRSPRQAYFHPEQAILGAAHGPSVRGDGLFIEAGKAALAPVDQHRFEPPASVPRDIEDETLSARIHRLRAGAVAMVV